MSECTKCGSWLSDIGYHRTFDGQCPPCLAENLVRLSAMLERRRHFNRLRFRRMTRQIAELERDVVNLAKLAADGPLYDDPIELGKVKYFRDHVLRAAGCVRNGQ